MISKAYDELHLISSVGRVSFYGVVSITPSATLDVDTQKPDGEDGAIITQVRFAPISADVTLQMWRDEQIEQFEAVVSQLGPSRDRQPQLLTPVHPFFDLFNVAQVYITKIAPSAPSSKSGYIVSLTLEEWFPPEKKKKAAPQSNSSSSSAATLKLDVNDILANYSPSAGELPAPVIAGENRLGGV